MIMKSEENNKSELCHYCPCIQRSASKKQSSSKSSSNQMGSMITPALMQLLSLISSMRQMGDES